MLKKKRENGSCLFCSTDDECYVGGSGFCSRLTEK